MASDYKPITNEDYEWRLQELEKAVAALCLMHLDTTGSVEKILQRERTLSLFRDHAAQLKHPILIGEVVAEDT